jgi:plastocyanin
LRKIQLTWLGVGAWVGAILGACEVAGAADHTIDMFQASFLPQSAEIELGQSVEWVWRKGSHTVTSGLPNGAAGTPNEPGALFDQVVDEAHPSFTFTFGELREGGFPFFCKQHPEQIGFIQIATGEVSFRVAVVDNVFNPEEVVIFEGDTVRWEHEPMEDVHTVTSGRSSSAGDSPGELFDEELSDALPVFAYQFLSAGDYAYFCRPHEHMGMKGLVHVQEKFVRGDATGEGVVDISDAVAILGALFWERRRAAAKTLSTRTTMGSSTSAIPSSRSSSSSWEEAASRPPSLSPAATAPRTPSAAATATSDGAAFRPADRLPAAQNRG